MYTEKLSDSAKCAIRAYSDSQSKIFNSHLIARVGLDVRVGCPNEPALFDGGVWEQTALILSAIYNAPVVHELTVYQVYKPSFSEYCVATDLNILEDFKIRPVLKENTNGNILGTYLQSTTIDAGSLKYLGDFHEKTCCFRKITLVNFPVLNISDISSYTYQKEVVLPPYIVYENKLTSGVMYSEYTQIINDRIRNQYPYCSSGQDSYVLNRENLEKTPMHDVSLKSSDTVVRPYYITRGIVSYINHILNKLYTHAKCDVTRTSHGKAHICNTIIFTLIIYASFYGNDTTKFDRDLITVAIFSSLFHDAGRECRDGEDVWEKESGELAGQNLGEMDFDKNSTGIVIGIITGEADKRYFDGNEELAKNLERRFQPSYAAYKGADSADIFRVKRDSYDPEYNPAYNVNGPFRAYTNRLLTVIKGEHNLVKEMDSFRIIVEYIETGDDREEELEDDEMFEKTGDWGSTIQYNYDPQNSFTRNPIVLTVNNTDPKKIKGLRREAQEQAKDIIRKFFINIRRAKTYFINNKYLRTPGRYFDDYMEILIYFLPYMPSAMVSMSSFIIPFEHRKLFRSS